MPSRIEQTFDQPKVREVILATGEQNVKLQIEFELIKLAALMSVGGNLNKAQITFIAEQLIQLFPNESIADFKICFQRGAIGNYGQIQRMDGITIREWFEKYLEEKYQILEDNLMKEKDQYYRHVVPENSERDYLSEWQQAVNEAGGMKAVPKLTEDEIKEEGQEQPKKKVYPFIESEAEVKHREVHEKIFYGMELEVRARHPEWTEEQIQERLRDLMETTVIETLKPKHLSCTAKIWAPKKKWKKV